MTYALPAKAIPHTCTLRARRQHMLLAYDTPAAAFTVGKTLTGATSHATAVIIGIPGTVLYDSSGAAIYTVPALTLALHTITGTFQDDETITDNGTVPGSAKVNGTIADAFNTGGSLVYTDIDTTTACKLYKRNATIKASGQALTITSTDRVMLPATVTPVMGDNLITTVVGFAGTWTLGSPEPKEGPGGILGHWECDLAKAGA
jgi:hypothetical protein